MMGKKAPFFDLDRYSSLPRPGPIPVPPHSRSAAFVDAPLRDCDGNNSEAQEVAAPTDAPSNLGSEWLQGWLMTPSPVRSIGLTGGHSGKLQERDSFGG